MSQRTNPRIVGFKAQPGRSSAPSVAKPSESSHSRSSRWIWLITGLALAAIALFFTGLVASKLPRAKRRMNDMMAIDECWERQRRPSLEPEDARLFARVCEAMESRYEQKHGLKP